ncbi:MAG: hypothetical protein ACRD0K_08695 [Egibacteraceae bacterium]
MAASAPTPADDLTIPILLLGVAIGLVVGFWAGRRWAERGRARFDGSKAMEARQNYRGMGPFWPFNK